MAEVWNAQHFNGKWPYHSKQNSFQSGFMSCTTFYHTGRKGSVSLSQVVHVHHSSSFSLDWKIIPQRKCSGKRKGSHVFLLLKTEEKKDLCKINMCQ